MAKAPFSKCSMAVACIRLGEKYSLIGKATLKDI